MLGFKKSVIAHRKSQTEINKYERSIELSSSYKRR